MVLSPMQTLQFFCNDVLSFDGCGFVNFFAVMPSADVGRYLREQVGFELIVAKAPVGADGSELFFGFLRAALFHAALEFLPASMCVLRDTAFAEDSVQAQPSGPGGCRNEGRKAAPSEAAQRLAGSD